jgi:glyceraldehyde 3-phosphate dehydrogenase
MTTVHTYTSTQAIVDGPTKKMRRGGAAAANLVPASTGAAIATPKALPQYEGKFDGIAARAPVPVGSIVRQPPSSPSATTVDEVNGIFCEEAESNRYSGILGVTEDLFVSSDIVQDPRASIVDLQSTQAVDGDLVKVMSWYDNEWGYAAQMVREAKRMIG